jgi:DNA replicative helicase MCM subunit Mcm2 (Cdc46/Mcm family)
MFLSVHFSCVLATKFVVGLQQATKQADASRKCPKKKKKKKNLIYRMCFFNAHQSFFFQGFCDEVRSGNYPLKHAAAANVAFCDEAKVASITLKHAATNVATPNRKIQSNVATNQKK